MRIALGLKELAVRVRRRQHRQGASSTPTTYRARNPMAQVPTLELTRTTARVRALTQSLAILEYLDERFREPAALAARSVPARARARARRDRQLRHPAAAEPDRRRTQVKALGGDDDGVAARASSPTASPRSSARPPTTAGTFCVGDAPTIADCCLVPQLASARRFGVDIAKHLAAARRSRSAASRCPRSPTRMPDRQPDAVKSRTRHGQARIARHQAPRRHPLLRARPRAQSRQFYCGKLDFAETWRASPELEQQRPPAARRASPPATSTSCAARAARRGRPRARASCASTPTASARSIFEVEDIERTFALLEERGGTPIDDIQTFTRRRRHAAPVLDHHAVRRHDVPLPRAPRLPRAVPGRRAGRSAARRQQRVRLPARSITSPRTSRP